MVHPDDLLPHEAFPQEALNLDPIDSEDLLLQEAFQRNHALVARHSKIPSYALWTPTSVGPPETWKTWWSEFNAPPDYFSTPVQTTVDAADNSPKRL